MSNIDVSKIKPGDTVRVRFQNMSMERAGVAPVEFTTTAYAGNPHSDVWAGGLVLLEHAGVTVLEHVPARPDWADAKVVRDKFGDGRLWLVAGKSAINCDGECWGIEELESAYGPVTVVLDADGNPPTTEPEWLDAADLDRLPIGTVAVNHRSNAWPRFLGQDGRWHQTGREESRESQASSAVAPARVLWTPEVPF